MAGHVVGRPLAVVVEGQAATNTTLLRGESVSQPRGRRQELGEGLRILTKVGSSSHGFGIAEAILGRWVMVMGE